MRINIHPKELAMAFAKERSDYQAEFLDTLADEINSWGDGLGGMQMLYVKDELSSNGKAFVKKLYEHICDEANEDCRG